MAEHKETDSKADPSRTFESASPYKSALHREPPIIEGQAVEAPVPDAGAKKADAKPAEKYVPIHTFEMASPFYKGPGPREASPGADNLAKDAPATAAKSATAGTPTAAMPNAVLPPQRSLSPIALLACALIGAGAGFAGAYAARHFLDDTQSSLSAFEQRLNATNTQIAADEKKIDAAASGSRDALSALDQRLSKAEKSAKDALALASAAQTQSAPAGSSDAGTAASAPASSSPAPAPDLAPLQSRIDMIEQRLMKLETTVNTPKTAERATQEPAAKPDPQQANAPAIAIIAENLVQKIGSGAPYESELKALENLGTDKTKLASLQPSAGKGIATTRALSDELTTLTPALLGGDKPATPTQDGAFARLLDHAKGLVQVQKIGDLSGENLSARIARVQNALAHDDVDAALKEWAGFPDPAKTASAHWAEMAKARSATIAGAKAIVSDAMANLAKVKS